MKFTLPLMALVLLLLLSGCATPWMTNTKRNAIEQYLISSVVERGISSASFKDYRNKKVAMDYTYFDPQTDKQYTQGVLELRLAELGMIVVKKAEEADYIIQPLCGILATDHSKIFLGTPSLPVPVPNANLDIVIPEIPLFQKFTRYGYGKFSFVVYEAKGRKPHAVLPTTRSSARYIDWVILLIPFKTHDMEMDDTVQAEIQYDFIP